MTTKLDNPDQKNPEKALNDSLKALDTPYLDLCAYSLTSQSRRKLIRVCRAHALARAHVRRQHPGQERELREAVLCGPC